MNKNSFFALGIIAFTLVLAALALIMFAPAIALCHNPNISIQ